MQSLNAGVVVVECDLIFVRILKQVERIDPAFVELSRFWIDCKCASKVRLYNLSINRNY